MSNRIKKLSRSLALLLFFAIVVMSTLMTGRTTAANAKAAFRQEHDIFYYTDATYTVQCGYYVFPCHGSVHQSGCVTEFYTEDWYDCNVGPGPQ